VITKRPITHKIDVVETCKRRVALRLLQTTAARVLSNGTIATALGWSVDELLDFWRHEKPPLVVKVKR
jgi:hypothetical protein